MPNLLLAYQGIIKVALKTLNFTLSPLTGGYILLTFAWLTSDYTGLRTRHHLVCFSFRCRARQLSRTKTMQQFFLVVAGFTLLLVPYESSSEWKAFPHRNAVKVGGSFTCQPERITMYLPRSLTDGKRLSAWLGVGYRTDAS